MNKPQRQLLIAAACLVACAAALVLSRPGRPSPPDDPAAFAAELEARMPGYAARPIGSPGYVNGFYLTEAGDGRNLHRELWAAKPRTYRGVLVVRRGDPSDLQDFPPEIGPWRCGRYVVCGDAALAARALAPYE